MLERQHRMLTVRRDSRFNVARLPYSLKLLFENLLRNQDRGPRDIEAKSVESLGFAGEETFDVEQFGVGAMTLMSPPPAE